MLGLSIATNCSANVSQIHFDESCEKQKQNKKYDFAADDATEDEEIVEKSESLCDTAKESELSEPPIQASSAIKELLIALEFNSIDMYN